MSKVLVTGASGFIAKHIVRELLEQGHAVRGTVRSQRRQTEVEALFPDASIEFVTLDLTADAGWDDALTGVDVLMHTASPFPQDEPDDPQELIRPAVDGTLRAMRAAHKAGVSRVILTSSCAAIYKDSAKPPMQRSTEANWTDPDADFVSAYEASKTLAERAAWEFAEANDMQLTTINPGGVFGPAMDSNYGTSLELVERFLDAADPMYPDINLPAVDVRDVAYMHVHAIGNDETVGERFAANAGAIDMIDSAKLLAQHYPDNGIKTRKAPNWLLRIVGRFDKTVRQVVGNLGRNSDVDGSKAERVMGFTYIPSNDALLASAAYVTEHRSS
jgi:dihydroflavonol-4-reductase